MNESKLIWHAVYSDGSVLSQVTDGVEVSSEQIDKTRLAVFVLTTRDRDHTIFTQMTKPGQRLMYRVRNAIQAGGAAGRVHVLAVEEDAHRYVVFVDESTMIVDIGDFTDDVNAPMRYSIMRLPHDETKVGG